MSSAKSLNTRDRVMEIVFLICAASSIVAVALISLFIFANSIPAISEIGWTEFLFGMKWAPNQKLFGILPMIVGSIFVTVGAAVVGVPLGILTAVYMTFYCPQKIRPFLQSGINLLAGIPSVVYGLWALEVIVTVLRSLFGGFGLSILAGIILLGIMILPTVITLSQSALEAVSKDYYNGAVALGSSHERAIFTVVIPAASSGVLSAIIMGIGRAIGETMAVKMIIGNQPVIPKSLFAGARTLTTNIVVEMAYASGLHMDALISTGAVLFVFILLLNIVFNILKSRERGGA